MKYWKSHLKMMTVLMLTLLPGLFLIGCRGNIGWDRMDGPLRHQSQSNVHTVR